MARIPGSEGFGNVIAEPQRNAGWTATPAGAVLGEALVRTGQQLAQRDAEAERQAKREREMADRAQAAHGIQMGRVELAQLADEFEQDVQLGRVEKDQAETEWDRRAGELSTRVVERVPKELSATVDQELQVERGSLLRRVRKAVGDRNRADTRGSLLGMLEGLEREAVTDRAGAVKKAALTLGSLGDAAGYGNDDQVTLLYQFQEKAAFNAAGALVRDARDDQASLDGVLARIKSDEFADLTPERAGQLENQVLGRKAALANQEAARIARSEAAAAKRDREAEAAFKATQGLIDAGAIPAPEYMERVAAQTAGTPYGQALKVLLEQASGRAGFAQLSPTQQQQQILSLRSQANTQGSTPELEKRISTFERLQADGQKQLADDPLVWGLNRRLIERVDPLQFGSVTDLVPQLQRRADQARTVGARAGVPVSPLLAAEAEQVANVLALLPLDQRTRAVTQLGKSVDIGMAQAMAGQISAKDPALGLAMFAAVAADGTPKNVAGLILRGADAAKTGRVKDDAAAKLAQTQIARELAEVPWATTKARDAAVQAAQLVYNGLKDERGSAGWREAIEVATGGGLTEWNDSKVPLPPGMDASRFRRTLGRLDPARVALQAGGDHVMVGGQAMPVATLVRNLGAVRLVPAGPGVYALDSGGQMVMTAGGRVLRLDVRALGD